MYVRCTITVTILSLCAHDTTQFVADTIAYFILYAVHLNALNMYVQVVYGSDYYDCIPTTEERRKIFAQFKRNYRETRKSIVIRNVHRRSAEFSSLRCDFVDSSKSVRTDRVSLHYTYDRYDKR